MEETKKCSKCGRELPLTEFHKCRRNSDGLQYMCKACQKEIARSWYVRHFQAVTSPPNTKTTNYTDPELDGKTNREVMDIMVRCKRWLEARGCTIHLSGEYTYTEVKQLKF